ncbi:tubulin folding cofactor D C terminal-domain-containing protein [Phyllosticta citribraziliensis]|uniref:Tubulin folding cofactor D C terminal-domain-containing protein n=1 Tax=Phyllosticta citribraziliensis TaxID=989973 RepID=A0ABR1LSZ9_9PEZI
MDPIDDEDVKLQRASVGLLSDLQTSLETLLWKTDRSGNRRVHRAVRQLELHRLTSLIEPFQEDPQLLDAHLKHVVPPLVSAYLERLRLPSAAITKPKLVSISFAISRILYTLCKVRGEKIIVGFLNNEPRYLEPMLDHVEQGLKDDSFAWEEKYVGLLWLSHLMLAPFDLASISSFQPPETAQARTGISLPDDLPGIVNRMIPICINHLECAAKERTAASGALVRLSLRPDMRRLGVLHSLVDWALSYFENTSEELAGIHRCIGVLTFLNGLVASANKDELGSHIQKIYRACDSIINQGNLAFFKSSAVSRKLIIKTFRNIVVHSLQSDGLEDTSALLEDVIDFLLQSVGDGDSPVRYAASKALSIIAMKLPDEMGAEVIEALLGCLDEDVLWEGPVPNLTVVNALRWHGLTLTLSHLLYRRAPAVDQLPEILNALVLALNFEQRSATGGSIGTNVRDAACFGIWAISRRYSTKELENVPTTSIRSAQVHDQSLSVIQVLGIELLTTACLDPAGNIRRGSSAALQELVGRHPDMVKDGISLVQTIDFHAVGLRDRALGQVSFEAAKFQQIYWQALFDGLLGWRGVGSLDSASRLATAKAVGRLGSLQLPGILRSMIEQVRAQLVQRQVREVEERHGLMLCLASLLDESLSRLKASSSNEGVDGLMDCWNLLNGQLELPEKAFTSPALRPEFTAGAVCALIAALARIANSRPEHFKHDVDTALTPLTHCLGRSEDSVLRNLPPAVAEISILLTEDGRKDLLDSWLSHLGQATTRMNVRACGYMMALGAVYPTIPDQNRTRIVEALASRCTAPFEIETRVIALRSLQLLFGSVVVEDLRIKIAGALLTALNDYTINERGDVGSLVRLEALNAMESAWQMGLTAGLEVQLQLHAAVLRLSLEKLDKVRLRAATCLHRNGHGVFESEPELEAFGVSSLEYFQTALKQLDSDLEDPTELAFVEGYISSAGMGSESVVQASRLALVEKMESLPVEGAQTSLFDVANAILGVFKANLSNDRIIMPLLDVVAFLFDVQVLQRLNDSNFKWRNLLSLVQKSHFKSNNIAKLHLALDAYRGLATVPAIRPDVMTKLSSMLLHAFPKIRVSAAETLFIITTNDGLKHCDWSQSAKTLKPMAEEFKRAAQI